MTFAQLCTAAAEPVLKQCVDRCAQEGRGYEIHDCQTPAGCVPERITVGFLRRGDGCLLYWRPSVQYRGNSRVLAALFARCTWCFSSYEALACRLYSLRREAGAPAILPYQPPSFSPAGSSGASPVPPSKTPPASSPVPPVPSSKAPPASSPVPPVPSSKTPPASSPVPPVPSSKTPPASSPVSPVLSSKTPPASSPDASSSLSARSHAFAHALHRPITRKESQSPWPALYLRLRDRLGQAVLGQDSAVEAAAYRLYCHAGKIAPVRPLSLIFYGPTGVGKSELGKALAPALESCCGRRFQSVWTELNTFTQPHSVHRLTGAPPGYVGYEDPPVFDAVRQNPCTVFMFDELEKAHPEVLKVFMSILDEGRCSAHRADEHGSRELDFRRCVFAFTTNANLAASSGRTLGFSEQLPIEPPDTQKTAASPAELAKRLFLENEWGRQAMVRLGVLPEIAGRFGGIIGFHALDDEARLAVTVKQIRALGREFGLDVAQVDPDTAAALAPAPDALSVRSSVCVLESLLAPLFADPQAPRRCRLSGTADCLRLSYFGISSSSTELSATS